MPIEFAPPQPNAQPFQVAPVQNTDPLQTLAEMGQLRNQAMQQQQGQMQLQQQRMQLRSNQAMMQAFAQGGGDFEKTQKLMSQSGDVLPGDMLTMQQHMQQYLNERAQYEKAKNDLADHDAQLLFQKYANVNDQPSLNAANTWAEQNGISSRAQRILSWSSRSSVTAQPTDPRQQTKARSRQRISILPNWSTKKHAFCRLSGRPEALLAERTIAQVSATS